MLGLSGLMQSCATKWEMVAVQAAVPHTPATRKMRLPAECAPRNDAKLSCVSGAMQTLNPAPIEFGVSPC